MNKLKNIVMSLGVILVVSSCVDDYQDANPPRLLDAPAVNTINISNTRILDGGTTTITIPVVDAPAGIDSLGYTLEILSGSSESSAGVVSFENFAELRGRTEGELQVTYTAPENETIRVELTFTVYDRQMREGEVVRKSSVSRSVVVDVVCNMLEGTYSAVTSGTSTDPGANNNPASGIETEVILSVTDDLGVYSIDKSTGKVFDAWYLGVYYADPQDVAGTLSSQCGEVTLTSYQSPFGDAIIQSSGSIGANGVITYTAMNEFGDEWSVVLTPQ